MGLRTMDPKELQVNPFTVFDDDWALLTVGTEDRLNAMTISWGGLGTFWDAPSPRPTWAWAAAPRSSWTRATRSR